jgi:diguanylate cyclase (GGDEF)-like protein
MGIDGNEFAVCTIRDDSERLDTEEELAAKAMRDPLTGLPNRTLLMDRLELAMQRMRRMAGAVAVLYVDLDWFKEINDEFGHLTGDAVLRDVAACLRGAVRPSDTVARIGGDEFVILCDPVNGPDSAHEIAERVLRALAQTTLLDEQAMKLSASVGVAVSWGPGTTSRALLHAADTALYRAKRGGRGRSELAPAPKRGD